MIQEQYTDDIIRQLLEPAADHITAIEYVRNSVEYLAYYKNEVNEIISNSRTVTKLKNYQLGLLQQKLLEKADDTELSEPKILYSILHIYIFAWQLMFVNNNDIPDIENHSYSLYNILNSIVNNWDSGLQQILDIDHFCTTVGTTLFSSRTQKNDINKHKPSNLEILHSFRNETASAEQVLEHFHMPPKNKSIWRPTNISRDFVTLKNRIDFLVFFQNYTGGDELHRLLSYKFRAQKAYVSLLEDTDLREFYDLAADELSGKARNAKLKAPHLVQEYDVKLMDLLVIEMHTRFGENWNSSYKSPLIYTHDFEVAKSIFPTFK